MEIGKQNLKHLSFEHLPQVVQSRVEYTNMVRLRLIKIAARVEFWDTF